MKPLFLLICVLIFNMGAAAQSLSRQQIITYADKQQAAAYRDLYRLLSLPNDAHFPEDLEKNREWLDSAFRQRGFTVKALPTETVPVLLAEKKFAKASKTVLVYLQADGQPVDAAHWEQQDPFGPVLKRKTENDTWKIMDWNQLYAQPEDDWRIFARSASDAKGPIVMFLHALDAMDAAGVKPNFNLKVVMDFEEELGSPHLPEAVRQYQRELAADRLIILDGPPHISNQPTLVFGARGIATVTLTVLGPTVPQHSGHYGNYAPNPAMRLAQLLASMKDSVGRVTIPGFYEGISIDEETRQVLAGVPDDEAMIRRQLGIAAPDQVGNSYQEALQYPSLNVRGLSAGWVGKEVRTIIPASATAEIDIRLVMESDPEKLISLIKDHIKKQGYHLATQPVSEADRQRYPRLALFESEISYRAFRTEMDSDAGQWLTQAYVRLYGKEPVRIRTHGGSIPISPFVTTLNIPAVIVPAVNPDNNQHSPNENIRAGNFKDGVRLFLSILTQKM